MIVRNALPAILFLAVCVVPASAGAPMPPAFAHLEATWNGISDYTMTIEAHEVLGQESADSELHYAFKKPNRARMDVIKGNNSGSTVYFEPPNKLTAYMRSFSVFKKHGEVREKDLTSLRGNSILNPNIGDVIACWSAHAGLMRQTEGPLVNGQQTDLISLPVAKITCPDDAAADRGVVTFDEIYIARDSGLIVMRKRYAGREILERWEITDYKLNTGLTDDDLT